MEINEDLKKQIVNLNIEIIKNYDTEDALKILMCLIGSNVSYFISKKKLTSKEKSYIKKQVIEQFKTLIKSIE